MNTFAALLTADDVLLGLEAANAKALFRSLAQAWPRLQALDAANVAQSLLAREHLGSTGLGEGVAIPHARIAGLPRAIAAIVRPKQPIAFDSPDGKPVGHLFVLLVPKEATEQHLQILAGAVQLLAQADFRDDLAACRDVGAVLALLREWSGENDDADDE